MKSDDKNRTREPLRWRNDSQAPPEFKAWLESSGAPEPPFGAEERTLKRLNESFTTTVRGRGILPAFNWATASAALTIAVVTFASVLYFQREETLKVTPATDSAAIKTIVSEASKTPLFATFVMGKGEALFKEEGGEAKAASLQTSVGERGSVVTGKESMSIVALGETATAYIEKESEVFFEKLAHSEVEIAIRRGAASFSVAKRGAERPFVVKTETAKVKVIGTIFSVAYGEDGRTTVAVQKGEVEVSSGKNIWRLEGGKAMTLGSSEAETEEGGRTSAAVERKSVEDNNKLTNKPLATSQERGDKLSRFARENDLFARGLKVQYDKKEPEAALKIWAEYLKEYPEGMWREDAAFHNGYALLEAGRPDAALRELASFVAEFARSHRRGEARLLMGNIYRINKGDCKAAEKEYKQALEEGLSEKLRAKAEEFLNACEVRR